MKSPWGSATLANVARRFRLLAYALVVALLVGVTADAPILPPRPGAGPGHATQPAPDQRWGSAGASGRKPGSGAGDRAGGSGNRTLPASTRSRYPLLSLPQQPASPRNTARVADPPPAGYRGFDARTSRELPSGRGEYERKYANADGTQTTEFSGAPVNYRGADGTWAPIDPRLEPAGAGWRNAADAVDVRLARRADAAELVRLALDGEHAVGYGLAGARPVIGRTGPDRTTVTYPDAVPGVDLELRSQPGGVKETLVLHSAGAPREYLFPLSLRGLAASVDGGEVRLTDAAGQVRAVFPAGYMVDAAGVPAPAGGVTYRLVPSGGGTALRVTLDERWLRDSARRYPVRVDPTVTGAKADSGMTVHGGSSTSGASDLLVGNLNGASAAYLKFDGLVGHLRYHTIFGAQLQVANYDSASCRPRPVTVHPVTQAWTAGSGYAYPGPSVGAALGSASFAHGYLALGELQSACPAALELVNLGAGGRSLVQRWVNGEQANHGLSLRASTTDALGWKRFAGTATANPPKLFVTHSPYNAAYAIPKPVPDPAVLQNQAGKVKVTVTNKSAAAWAPGDYYLAYRAYNAQTGAAVTQQRAANLTGTVARGGRVTLEATIRPLPPGVYFLDFTMVKTGGVVFTDEQVPPARLVLQVFDIPPVVQELYPPNGYQAPTLTPQLWARALDVDAPPGSSLRFKFEVCARDAAGNPVSCFDSGYLTSTAWTVPAGRLSWAKTYLWRAFVKDATTEVPSPRSAIVTSVPQPEITSRLANAPASDQSRDFDPQVGNYSAAAVDASVATVGPELTVVRTYNSLDPRRDGGFGAGWVSRYDMRVRTDDDGSGNVVVGYPDGQQVRFGRNPDGTYAAPQGRTAALTTTTGGGWRLVDTARAAYEFSAAGRLTRIADASGRAVVLTYNLADGKLARATVSNSQTNTAGRSLHFTWTGAHVTRVSTDPVDGTALAWTYTYTGDVLTKVCGPADGCTTYGYTAGSHLRSAVLDSRPESYWRLGEAEGTAAGSQVAVNLGKDAATYRNATLGAAGALAGTADTAAAFNGSSSFVELPKGTVKKSRDLAVELWFKNTTTGSGGPLLGYQDKAVGAAATTGVPVLYVGTDGRLRGQFATGSVAPITSAATVNDGRWHHVVLSAMDGRQTLYLDGAKVGELAGAIEHSLLTFNQVGAAYASTPTAWPAWGTVAQRFYAGTIDEVAVYAHPLGPAAVAAHHAYGTAAADQLATVTLPSGKVAAEVAYDVSLDRVNEYTDRNGGTWKIGAPTVYGGNTDLRRGVQVLDPADRAHLYEFDAVTGRVLRTGVPAGLVARPEDAPGDPTTPPGEPVESCTQPDPNDPKFCTVIPGTTGGPVFVAHPVDGIAIRSFSYDARGYPSGVTNENGETVSMTFDDRGNLTSRRTCRTAGECHTAWYTYPSFADPLDPRNTLPTESRDARSTSATDNRYRTTYTYTASGDVVSQSDPAGNTVRNTYSTGTEQAHGGGFVPAGLVLTTTDQRSAVTRFAYYANGDLARVTTPSGLATTYTYDAIGRTVSETEVSDAFPNGVTTTYTYDALSRPVSTTEPATTDAVSGTRHQRRTTNGYDADGNVVRIEVSDLLGGDHARVSTFEFDEHNLPSRVVDAEGNESTFSHDRHGNRTSMVDANGNRYDYAYTARNLPAEIRLRDYRPSAAGEPDPGDYLVLRAYAYDFAGRLVADTDAMGRRLEYRYFGDDLVRSVTLKDFHNSDGSTRDYVVEANTYDGAGNLTEQVTGNGRTVTRYQVDPVGRVASTVTDPAGLARTTTFTYDPAGNVTRTVLSGRSSGVPWSVANATETVEHTYDAVGNLDREAVTASGGTSVTTYAQDQRGLVTSVTDPNGNDSDATPAAHTVTYGYDELGRQVRATSPAVATGARAAANPTRLTGYDTYGQEVAVKDERGNVTQVRYDRVGRPVGATLPEVTPPSGIPVAPTVRIGYDGLGNTTEVVDPSGAVTRYGYDRLGRMASRDEPGPTGDERAVWGYTYTRTGKVHSVTDPSGARVETTYDDLDRPVTVTTVERRPVADNLTTRYAYDDAGDATAVTSPTGAVTTHKYDAVGELLRTVDPAGVVTEYGYDFAGRQVRTRDGLGRTARTDYDALGRVAGESDLAPDGTVLRSLAYRYDASGNLVASTDALGKTTTYRYDALYQLVEQVEPVSPTTSITTSFGYDAAGNLTRYTDGRGNTTEYTYNALGLLESTVEPVTPAHPDAADRTWSTAYDAAGNPVRERAPGGVVRSRSFDAAGRLTRETGSGAEVGAAERTLGYDALGRLTSVSTPGGTDTYTYDDRGNLLTANGPSGTATFRYDGNGAPTERTDAAGTARFTYAAGRLTTMTDGLTGVTQQVDYDASGALASIAYGAGATRTFEYDDLGRMSSDTTRTSAGQSVASVSYGYNLEDNLTGKTATGTAGAADNTYTYDEAGRLASWTAGRTTTRYGWDDAGNRIQAGAKTATYDARNRLLSDGDYTYTYNARGGLTGRTSSGLTDRYSFDAFDRLVSGAGEEYAYDGLDRVAARNGVPFGYAGTSDEPVSDGTESYARGPLDELLAFREEDEERLAVTDEHGDLVGSLDPAGALAGSTAYDPFGQEVASAGGPEANLGFQSDYTDPETGQVNMGARWYAPGTGGFVSRDTVNYTSGPSVLANRYTYGAAAPLDYTDPDGNMPCLWCAAKKAASWTWRTVTAPVRWGARQVGNLLRGAWNVVKGAWNAVRSGVRAVGRCFADPRACLESAKNTAKRWAEAAKEQYLDPLFKRGKDLVTPWLLGIDRALEKGPLGAQYKRAKAKAREIARKAPAVAKRIKAEVMAAVTSYVKYHPIARTVAAAYKAIFSGRKAVVAATPVRPARETSARRDVVADTRRMAEKIYQRAVEDSGPVVGQLSTASDVAVDLAPVVVAPIAVETAVGVTQAAAAVSAAVRIGAAAARYGDLVKAGRVVGKVAKVADDAADAAELARRTGGCRTPNSFTPQTHVLMADGTTKPIAEVRAGDKVLATDPTTGKTRVERVTDVIVGFGEKRLVEVAVATGAGRDSTVDTVTATDGHPFWVEGLDRWVEAGELEPGHRFETADHRTATVTGTRTRSQVQQVYNLTVDRTHTYHVLAGGAAILVHNADCDGPGDEIVPASERGITEPNYRRTEDGLIFEKHDQMIDTRAPLEGQPGVRFLRTDHRNPKSPDYRPKQELDIPNRPPGGYNSHKPQRVHWDSAPKWKRVLIDALDWFGQWFG